MAVGGSYKGSLVSGLFERNKLVHRGSVEVGRKRSQGGPSRFEEMEGDEEARSKRGINTNALQGRTA